MASPFASHSKVTVAVPTDPGQTVTFRKLTGLEVEHAQSEHLKGIIAGRSARGWSQAFQRVLAKGATDADAAAAIADPLVGYDRLSIVRAGLVDWSYPLPVQAQSITRTGDSFVSAVDYVADLDDETLEWLAREILKLTKPGLFQTQDEAEAARHLS